MPLGATREGSLGEPSARWHRGDAAGWQRGAWLVKPVGSRPAGPGCAHRAGRSPGVVGDDPIAARADPIIVTSTLPGRSWWPWLVLPGTDPRDDDLRRDRAVGAVVVIGRWLPTVDTLELTAVVLIGIIASTAVSVLFVLWINRR